MGGMLAVLLAVFALSEPAAAPDVVVTAAAPVNAQRLADALRAYLTDYGIRVGTAGAGASGDLRQKLGEARRTGEAVRAVAVVRAETGAPGVIEIELVDLATQKALVTSVPRPPRDEDLYRALALKIGALLRSTLSEAPERLASGSGVARLAEASPGGLTAHAAEASPPRLSLETGYAAVSFPLGGLFLQGLSVTGVFAAKPWLELSLGAAGLGATKLQEGEVASIVPLVGAARLRLARRRFELLAGPSVEIALARVAASSPTASVRSSRDMIVALGGEAEGRVRIGAAVWLYLRPSLLGVLLGPRYTVQGRPILDASRLEITVAAGIAIGMR